MTGEWPQQAPSTDPFADGATDVTPVRFDPVTTAAALSAHRPDLDQAEATRLAWLAHDDHRRTDMPDPGSDRLIAIDIEATGLAPRRDLPLEIGCVVVDADLEPLDDGISVVIGCHRDTIRELAADVVWDMHTRNGLIEECHRSLTTAPEAERMVLEYLSEHTVQGQSGLINNNAPFERGWFDHQFSGVASWLHYRGIDASVLHTAGSRWWPRVCRQEPPKAAVHRALPDCFASLEQARHYRDRTLEVPVYDEAALTAAYETVARFESPEYALEYARQVAAAAIAQRALQATSEGSGEPVSA